MLKLEVVTYLIIILIIKGWIEYKKREREREKEHIVLFRCVNKKEREREREM